MVFNNAQFWIGILVFISKCCSKFPGVVTGILGGGLNPGYTPEVQVDYFLHSLSEQTIVLVRVYSQDFQETIILMVGLTSRVCVSKQLACLFILQLTRLGSVNHHSSVAANHLNAQPYAAQRRSRLKGCGVWCCWYEFLWKKMAKQATIWSSFKTNTKLPSPILALLYMKKDQGANEKGKHFLCKLFALSKKY